MCHAYVMATHFLMPLNVVKMQGIDLSRATSSLGIAGWGKFPSFPLLSWSESKVFLWSICELRRDYSSRNEN